MLSVKRARSTGPLALLGQDPAANDRRLEVRRARGHCESDAHLLLIDESGSDHRNSPCTALADIAILYSKLWDFARALRDAEFRRLVVRYSTGESEIKAKKLLKKKVFRQAGYTDPIPEPERTNLAKRCLNSGYKGGLRQPAALAQAKLAVSKETSVAIRTLRYGAYAISTTLDRRTKDSLNRKGNQHILNSFSEVCRLPSGLRHQACPAVSPGSSLHRQACDKSS